MEQAAKRDTRLLILCNPHNPTGRVLTLPELEDVASFAEHHGLIVCSDEMHCELILDEQRQHIPFANVSLYAKENSITLVSPGKVFSLAGENCGAVIIFNDDLRQQYSNFTKTLVSKPTALAYVALEAAYKEIDHWKEDTLMPLLRKNHHYLYEAINSLPGLSMAQSEGTNLAWIRCDLPGVLKPSQLFEQYGVNVSDGSQFGDSVYIRLNFGCGHERLRKAVSRISAAVNDVQVSQTDNSRASVGAWPTVRVFIAA